MAQDEASWEAIVVDDGSTDHPSYVYDRTTPDSICHIVADGDIEAVLEYRRKGSWDSPHARRFAPAN